MGNTVVGQQMLAVTGDFCDYVVEALMMQVNQNAKITQNLTPMISVWT